MDGRRNELATKALALSVLLERGLLEVAREKFGDSEPTMMKGIESSIALLKSVHETRWPASVISDTDKPGERIMRSVGLTLVNVPEIVMNFELDESDVAVGIFRDLVTTAVDDPEEARGKIFPGRRVYAFRFGRKYYMHCALTDPCGCDICTNDDDVDTSEVTTEGAPIWDTARAGRTGREPAQRPALLDVQRAPAGAAVQALPLSGRGVLQQGVPEEALARAQGHVRAPRLHPAAAPQGGAQLRRADRLSE